MSDPIDIVERLRTRPTGDPYLHMMAHEAADEIARLRAAVISTEGEWVGHKELARMRAALAAQVPQWISVTDDRKPKIGQDVLLWVRAERHSEDDDGRPYSQDASGVHQGRYIDSVCGPRFDCYTTPVADHEMATHWIDEPAAPGASHPPAALAAQAPQWMPIESAPKDGTEVLVWPPTWSGGRSTAKWSLDQYAKKPRPYWRRSDDLGKVTISREKPPSHWMPTPAAPGASPPPAALAVPAGMALVPVEPTQTMREAPAKDRPGFSPNVAREIWARMLAASPQATAADMKPNGNAVGRPTGAPPPATSWASRPGAR